MNATETAVDHEGADMPNQPRAVLTWRIAADDGTRARVEMTWTPPASWPGERDPLERAA